MSYGLLLFNYIQTEDEIETVIETIHSAHQIPVIFIKKHLIFTIIWASVLKHAYLYVNEAHTGKRVCGI